MSMHFIHSSNASILCHNWMITCTRASAGKDIAQILKDKSVLAILNTKGGRVAGVSGKTTKTLKSQGAVFVAFDKSVPEKDILRIAENCPDDHILCIHTSTQSFARRTASS